MCHGSKTNLLFMAIVLGFGGMQTSEAEDLISSATFGELSARSIGPAAMGGRIAAIDAVMRDRLTIYVGAAGGGVWKSINGGTTFKPVFDKYTQAIGAVTIDRANPDTVWVGTGESWVRNSVSVGDGVYKSTDGGDNWTHMGLKDSERISRIVVHPTESDTVFVCATGHLWDANEERGVFKTTDGGKTWEKVLYVDPDTGCGSIDIDPQQPDILYASMWQFRRWPDRFKSGGPGSGLYKTTDGGKTWKKLMTGLPQGELGRIAVAVAPSRPSMVYATVECEDTAMYRSDDLGETWRRTGSTSAVEARPFYFSLLVVDPVDFNRVYKPASSTAVTNDGGETFSGLMGSTHSDHHAFWINPGNNDQLMVGTDGGLYMSYDRGVNWNFLQALPISQFYHVSYDMNDPYNVYGGLQDNGTWRGPSSAPGGVLNKHWDNIGFGDGFHAHVDRGDSDIAYVEWQGGRIQRVRMSTGESKDIQPRPFGEGAPKLRFNWNSPIHLSPNRTDTLYIGAQFLFRSRDRGESWDQLSDDLTTNDPEKQRQIESGGLTPDNSTAENHCTIYAISESPLDENVVWVGTDDGNVQVTRDGGAHWSNVTDHLPGAPPATWVTSIDASHFEPGTAYVTLDGHRTGDMTTYVYKTTDFGATFASLANDGIEGYSLVIREDTVNRDLLFLGTEFGLYISIDGGANWARFKEDLPKVGVRDIAIHPREHDVMLATHGRGIYIIDDITPLRHLTKEVLESDVAMLPSRPAQARIPAGVQSFSGDNEFVGNNPPSSAQITYYLKKRHVFGDMRIEIYDADGEKLASLPAEKRVGLNRVGWSMRMKAPKVAPAASLVPQMSSFIGPHVAEGTYTVKLIKGKKTYEGAVEVVADPRADYSVEDKALQDKTVIELYRMTERLTYVVDALLDLQSEAKKRGEGLDEGSDLRGALKEIDGELEAYRKTLVATRKGGFIAGEEQLREELTALYGTVNGFEGRPTDSHLAYKAVLARKLENAEKQFDEMAAAQLAKVNPMLEAHGLAPLIKLDRSTWQERQESD